MTDPLVPKEVDLRDFPYMPFEVVRLRDSETVIHTSGDGFKAAVLLWCAAWHQVPAASLPDDDRTLAHLTGYGKCISAWQEIRDEALRGFVKCSDGRLYHTTISEKANEAWATRKAHREKLEKARAAKAAKEAAKYSNEEHTVEANEVSMEGPYKELKGREGKGREESLSSLRSERDSAPTPKTQRGKPLPDDWRPPEELFEYGESLGLMREETAEKIEQMRLWAQANRNRSIAKKADWIATFQGGLRRDAQTIIRNRARAGPSRESRDGLNQALEAIRNAKSSSRNEFGTPFDAEPSTAGLAREETRPPRTDFGGPFLDLEPIRPDG